jgi:hypothetical protein
MGIDYSADYADVIEWNAIVELAPEAAAEFMATINKHKGDEEADYLLQHLAFTIQYDLCGDPSREEAPTELINAMSGWHNDEAVDVRVAKEILAAFRKLRAAFSEATNIPTTTSRLELGIAYHDSENQGCRGDELDGVYWYVDGAYELSPAGRKFKRKFERRFFTAWG